MLANKKGLTTVVTVLIILGVFAVIGTGGYLLRDKLPFVAEQSFIGETFSLGCQQVLFDGSPIKEISSSFFECKNSECIVQGSLTLATPSEGNKVFARSTVSKTGLGARQWYSILNEQSGALESWCPITSTTTRAKSKVAVPLPYGDVGFLAKTGTGSETYLLIADDDSVGCGNEGDDSTSCKYFRYEQKSSCGADVSPDIKYGCDSGKGEKCDNGNIYEAYFDFYPTNQPDYDFGPNGDLRRVEGEYGTSFFTNEVRLSYGQTLQFNARDGNGNLMPNNLNVKKLIIREADCSCVDKVANAIACDINAPNNVLCTGSTTYKECTTNTDSSGCFQWGGEKNAVGGLQCFPVDGSVGNLKCDVNAPAVGQKKKISNTEYQIGITNFESSCTQWSETRSCPAGLNVDLNIAGDVPCGCPANDAPASPVCTSTTSREIGIYQTIGGKQCLIKQTQTAPGELVCKNGQFTCDTVNKCTVGQVECVGSNQYKECAKDPSDANSCYDYRAVKTLNADQACINDQIVNNPEQGCFYGTQTCDASLGLICSPTSNQNDPTFNQCVCNANAFDLATYEDFINGAQQCDGNTPKEVKRIGSLIHPQGAQYNCYEWKDKSAQCAEDEICRVVE